jgi:chromosome segregation ATPase
LSSDNKRLNENDPIVLNFISDFSELKVKVARLEERQNALEKSVDYLKQKVEQIDSKLWYILAGVIATFLAQIILRLF